MKNFQIAEIFTEAVLLILRIAWPVLIGLFIIHELYNYHDDIPEGATLTIKGTIVAVCSTIIAVSYTHLTLPTKRIV